MFTLPFALLLTAVLLAQEIDSRRFASPALARELAHRLQSAALPAFAAAHPDRPGAFVAVLYVPEQLLVVDASHPAKAALEERIAAEQYREVYLDLQGTPTPQGGFFVLDAGADGLLTALPGQGSVDMLDDGARPMLLLNGDPQGQEVSKAEYNARIERGDMKYTELLRVLTEALQSMPPQRSSSGA